MVTFVSSAADFFLRRERITLHTGFRWDRGLDARRDHRHAAGNRSLTSRAGDYRAANRIVNSGSMVAHKLLHSKKILISLYGSIACLEKVR